MPPSVKAAMSSPGESGGVRKSGAVPISLAWIRDELALAKLLFSTAIMIRPGPTNWAKLTPSTARRPPIATTNTIM